MILRPTRSRKLVAMLIALALGTNLAMGEDEPARDREAELNRDAAAAIQAGYFTDPMDRLLDWIPLGDTRHGSRAGTVRALLRFAASRPDQAEWLEGIIPLLGSPVATPDSGQQLEEMARRATGRSFSELDAWIALSANEPREGNATPYRDRWQVGLDSAARVVTFLPDSVHARRIHEVWLDSSPVSHGDRSDGVLSFHMAYTGGGMLISVPNEPRQTVRRQDANAITLADRGRTLLNSAEMEAAYVLFLQAAYDEYSGIPVNFDTTIWQFSRRFGEIDGVEEARQRVACFCAAAQCQWLMFRHILASSPDGTGARPYPREVLLAFAQSMTARLERTIHWIRRGLMQRVPAAMEAPDARGLIRYLLSARNELAGELGRLDFDFERWLRVARDLVNRTPGEWESWWARSTKVNHD